MSKNHCMISYQWDSQQLVLRIHGALKKAGINVWLDIAGGMKGNINAAMAEGVEGAACIVPVMTAKYQASRNCQKELNYADVCRIPIVPVMAQSNWRQTGWLGVMTAGALYTSFTEESNFDESVRALVNEIREAAPACFTGTGEKIEELSVDDVIRILAELDLAVYAGSFKANGVDGKMLKSLSKQELQEDLAVKKIHVDKLADRFGLPEKPNKPKPEKPLEPTEQWLRADTKDTLVSVFQAHQVPIETKEPKKGETALILAARRGDVASVKWLLEQKANINHRNVQGITALMAAVTSGGTGSEGEQKASQRAVINALIDAGADVNVVDEEKADTALTYAIFRKQIDLALLLIEHKADVNFISSKDGEIPLHDAAALGDVRLVSAILARMKETSGNVNLRNLEGQTPLHNATKNAQPKVVELLLAAGIDIQIKDNENKTALQVSAEYECSRQIVATAAKSPEGERKAFFETADINVVKAFLQKYPTDVEISDGAGDTKLILSARAGKTDLVKCLVNEFGASVNNPNKQHSSPLMASAMRGYDEIVSFLITKGANLNQRTKNLDSPLSLAVWKNHSKTARILIDAGASVTGIDNFGDSMMHDAAKNGNLDLVKFFLTKQMSVNHQNNEGLSPLYRAAESGHPDIVKTLLDAGADWTLTDKKNHTPLEIAKDERSKRLIQDAIAMKAAKEAAAKKAAEAAVSAAASAPPVAAGGGGGISQAQLQSLISAVVEAMNSQTAEIRKLREAVEKMHK